MSISNIKVNNSTISTVNTEPQYNNDNLVESDGIYFSIKESIYDISYNAGDKLQLDTYILEDGVSIRPSSGYALMEMVKVNPGEVWLWRALTGAEIPNLFGYSNNKRSNPVSLLEAPWRNYYRKEEITIPEGVYYIQGYGIYTRSNMPLILKKKNSKIDIIETNIDLINQRIDSLPIELITITDLYYDSTQGNLRSFLESIIDSSSTNQYVIYIAPGTYDLTSTISLDEYGTYPGLAVPDFTTLIGTAGANNTIITLDLSSTVTSTLIMKKTSSIKGLSVIGKHCRYVIHDDYSENNDNTHRVIENCYIEAIDCTYAWAYGGGSRSGQHFEYKNTIFKGGGGYEMHTNTNFTKPTTYEFENCQFIGTDNGHLERSCELRGIAGLDSPVTNPCMNYVTISNSKIDGMSIVCSEDSDFDLDIVVSKCDVDKQHIVHVNNDYEIKFFD